MTNHHPLVLLDFDGVINAIRETPSALYPEETWHSTRLPHGVRWYPIKFSDVVLDALRRAGDVAEVKYLSTWREHTAQFADTFDLPQWGYLDESTLGPRPEGQPRRHWKVEVAEAAMAGNTRPILWIDDDIPFMSGARELLAERREVADLVTVHPEIIEGLSPVDLDRIEEFLRAYG